MNKLIKLSLRLNFWWSHIKQFGIICIPMGFEILLHLFCFLEMHFLYVYIEMSELICSFMRQTIEWTTYWMMIPTQHKHETTAWANVIFFLNHSYSFIVLGFLLTLTSLQPLYWTYSISKQNIWFHHLQNDNVTISYKYQTTSLIFQPNGVLWTNRNNFLLICGTWVVLILVHVKGQVPGLQD